MTIGSGIQLRNLSSRNSSHSFNSASNNLKNVSDCVSTSPHSLGSKASLVNQHEETMLGKADVSMQLLHGNLGRAVEPLREASQLIMTGH